MRKTWFLIFSLTAIFIPALAAAGKDKNTLDPALAALADKVDARTAEISTIKARFSQRKEVSLLKEPVVMNGDFYFKRKSGFKFAFDKEHDLIIVITNQETIILSPEARKADRIKVKKRHGRLVERLLSDKIASLTDNFRIEQSAEEAGDGYHLILSPTKRRVKKRVDDLHIWIDKDYLIYRLKMTGKDGDVYELTLEDIQLNVDVPEDTFELEIPEDFEHDDRMDFLFGAGAAL